MKRFDLPTPALVADLDRVTGNMDRMAQCLLGTPVRLRPHYKSHKCAALAHRQIAAGAVGMTCAKLSEAEDLIFSGVNDVLIANQVVERGKVDELARLARLSRLTVCVDDVNNAKDLSLAAAYAGSTVHCLVEYDIGMDRCGTRTPEGFLAVAQAVARLPNLCYEGIQAYAGHVSHMISSDDRRTATRENERKVAALMEFLRRHGLESQTVSGGSTGTCGFKAGGGVYTELQPGSYLFLDTTYGQLDLPFQNALFVLATVVSKQNDTVILDVGVKGLGADQDSPVVLDSQGNRLSGYCELNEEHLKLYDSHWAPSVGDKAIVIPGHCCSTVNLYDWLYLYRRDAIVERVAVTARGRSQ